MALLRTAEGRGMTSTRRFKVRGQDLIGTEVERVGSAVRLMCAPPCWPFVRERVFDRADLVRLDGSNSDDEPSVTMPLQARGSRKADP